MNVLNFTAILESLWYGGNPLHRLLIPLGWVYRGAIALRASAYSAGIFRTTRTECLVIVVGNLTVGGTGKTPLVIWLSEWLRENGWTPGVISRGYGGRNSGEPMQVFADSDPAAVGDEAILVSRRTGVPVFVCAKRTEAARSLLNLNPCDILISDDGLQHYALGRDIEVVVVDRTRGFGNRQCLPAGPLREPVSRLDRVDLVIYNGASMKDSFCMQLTGCFAVNLASGNRRPLDTFRSTAVHAIAAIGNPARFFDLLKSMGLSFDSRTFADHHPFSAADILFDDNAPVLMTEKDAVKCSGICTANHWFVPVAAEVSPEFPLQLKKLLGRKNDG